MSVLIASFGFGDSEQGELCQVIRNEILHDFDTQVYRTMEELLHGLEPGHGSVSGIIFLGEATQDTIRQARRAMVGVRVVIFRSGMSPAIMHDTDHRFIMDSQEIWEYAPVIRAFLRPRVRAEQGLPSG
jgi:hypothetical protein